MADKTGYIGRNPNDSAVTVARQFFTASGVTTAFTFASGYLTGYLDVYVDGVKKRVADEFTATDGSTFDVLQGGVGAGSTVEAVAYKAFNATTVSGDITGNFDVSGNTTLGGSLNVVGGTTVTNLVVTGISTLGTGTTVGFANTAFNLGGTPNISVDLLSAVDINVSGAATIGGVLTYEDVTNIDSIGIVTARTGVEVTANGLVVNAGVGTFAADLSIADKLVHTGDTNTSIRFPTGDTITAETAGVERLRIDSTGDVGLVGIATATGLVVVAGSGIYAGHTGVVTAVSFDGSFTGNVTGAASQVTVADESSDTTCFPLFTTAATGNLPPKSGTNLTFNSSTGALTATSFVGALTGNVTGNADTATNASGLTGTPNIDCGTGSFTGDVDIADKIVHTGDTNTAIRFPAADTFTVETGGSEALRVDSSQRLIIGENSSSGLNAFLQVIGDPGAQVHRGVADASGSSITLSKSRNTTYGSNTIVQDDDLIGSITFRGDDGTDYNSTAALISASVDGTPGSNDMPGRLVFSTTADGASSPTERLRIDSSGRLLVSTTSSTSNIAGYGNGGIQLNSTTTAQANVNIIHRNNSANTHAIVLAKARDGAANGGRVQDDDDFGAISFQGFDGTGGSTYRQGAEIRGAVDGTPGNTDMPGRLEFLTTPDGSATPTERLRITSAGNVGVNDNDPSSLLSISQTNGNAKLQIKRANSASNSDDYGSILWRSAGGTAVGAINVARETGEDNGYMFFQTTSGGTMAERLRIDSRGSFLFSNGLLAETVRINTTARTGTQAVYLNAGNVHYFTSSSTGTWKPNFTMSTTPDINDTISTGDTFSVTMIVNKSNTAHYADSAQVDGSDITVEWLGGAPTDGGGNNTFDVYSYTIIKTANDTFIAFASVSNYE